MALTTQIKDFINRLFQRVNLRLDAHGGEAGIASAVGFGCDRLF